MQRRPFSGLYAKSTAEPANRPDVVNLDYWFHPHVIRQLSRLRQAIAACHDRDARLFLLVCLSVCVRKVSLADPRLSVPVRLRQDQYGTSHSLHEPTKKRLRRLRHIDALTVFRSIVEANSRRMSQFCDLLDETVPPRFCPPMLVTFVMVQSLKPARLRVRASR